jgi:indole-3-glycerol phosphate synthase
VNILDAITAERRADAERASKRTPLALLKAACARRVHHSLAARLASGRRCVIAEMKKASPSAGLLRPRYSPASLARSYEASGASAISVLTEPRRFLGSGAHLRAARAACSLPILRKDFISRPYQVWEAAAWGADAILLIVAALDSAALAALHSEARTAGLETLMEAHTAAELETALEFGDVILGVNSRNLKTLKTDLRTAFKLAALIPRGRLAVAESGIRTRAEIERLEDAGYRGFLIGETLLRANAPGAALASLAGGNVTGA